MNTQNILKFFGSKLTVKLDSSEFYDYEIGKTELDYDPFVIDFNNEIDFTGLTLNSSCITGTNLNSIKPWEIEIAVPYTAYTCDFEVRRRTEEGWTLDFVFNKEELPWLSGSTFYYWGIKNETNPDYYLDNNLSFSFTSDGRIKWESYRYSGYCDNTDGYTETSYISSGQTPALCTEGTSEDFNVTITFDRNIGLYGECDLPNEGGWNDLVSDYTVLNPLDVLTGDTEDIEYVNKLNSKWFNERDKRLGTLKIYLNGKPIYKLEDWEEIIPREYINPIVQVWGGGTNGVQSIHTGTTSFNLKRVKYFENPLSFPEVLHHYRVSTEPFYSINKCGDNCEDDIYNLGDGHILLEDGGFLLGDDDNHLLYNG
jgi:hypothetical protein